MLSGVAVVAVGCVLCCESRCVDVWCSVCLVCIVCARAVCVVVIVLDVCVCVVV